VGVLGVLEKGDMLMGFVEDFGVAMAQSADWHAGVRSSGVAVLVVRGDYPRRQARRRASPLAGMSKVDMLMLDRLLAWLFAAPEMAPSYHETFDLDRTTWYAEMLAQWRRQG
jgi:hypothetical protein